MIPPWTERSVAIFPWSRASRHLPLRSRFPAFRTLSSPCSPAVRRKQTDVPLVTSGSLDCYNQIAGYP